jgi:hypothetical protein
VERLNTDKHSSLLGLVNSGAPFLGRLLPFSTKIRQELNVLKKFGPLNLPMFIIVVHGRLFQLSIILVGKARSLP